DRRSPSPMPLPKQPTRMGALLQIKAAAPAQAPASTAAKATPASKQTKPAATSAAVKSSPAAGAPAVSRKTTKQDQTAPPAKSDSRAIGAAGTVAEQASAAARPKAVQRGLPAAQRKLFVLDTNVLLHDPTSLFRFAEHDV